MKKIATSLLFLAGLLSSQAQNYIQYVDPLIGSGDHGHVFVGANVPFGLIQAGPTQIETGWDWCSGYHYTGDSIVGFAQQHLSGTGCSDLGDIAIMPLASADVELSRAGLAQPFSHDNEVVSPGYYCVTLPSAKVEITASQFSAFYRIDGSNLLALDLQNGVGDIYKDSHLEQIDETTFIGHRLSRGWATSQTVYFTMHFSCPVDIARNNNEGIYLLQTGQEQYECSITLSYNKSNFGNNQIPAKSFDQARRDAENKWNEMLGRVNANFMNERDRRIFYTCLYHFMIEPSSFFDQDGNPTRMTTFSLWDTYRAASPLSTILLPEQQKTIAESFVDICNTQGYIPVWHLMGNETNCMVGSPGVIVLSDIILKGFDVDIEQCYSAIRTSLYNQDRGMGLMQEYGYIPVLMGQGESVAKTLEYAIAYWSGARVAEKLGQEEDMKCWDNLALAYQRLYDKRVGYFRGRYPQKWCKEYASLAEEKREFLPLDDFNPQYQTNEYTEGNPWQYLFLVPHDVKGLVELVGGKDIFLSRLDSLFTAPSELNADANPDISGLIGQYAHGNEPSHHILYMYHMIGVQEKGNVLLRYVMNELYHDRPDGLCGNEDCGQMSAWYLMSALGMYQVEPAGGRYWFGSPIITDAVLRVADDKLLKIVAHGNSAENINIAKVKFNGEEISCGYIMHEQLIKGGTLEFFMTK